MLNLKMEVFRTIFVKYWRNKWIIALAVSAAFFAGMILTEYVANKYTFWATASVFITDTGSQGQSGSKEILVNYSDIVKSKRVCENAKLLLEDTPLTAEQIKSMLSITVSKNAYFMDIAAYSYDPNLAIRVANAVAEMYIAEISSIYGENFLEILDFAETASYSSNEMRTKLRLGTTAGAIIIICGYIALKELLSNKLGLVSQYVEDEDEILAIIPYVGQEHLK